MFMIFGSMVLLLAELVLLLLAWKTWTTTVRGELPLWRNSLSCVALVLLSLNWCGAAVLAAQVFARHASGVAVMTEVMLTLSRPLDVTATLLAIALKGGSRVKAIVAGVLMFAGLPLGYV